MKSKILLLLIISFFAFSSNVSAGICDSEHIKQLKELAKQVEVSYEYLDYSDEISGEEDGEFFVNTYLITVNLLSDDLYVIHDGYEYYSNSDNGGIVTFVVNSGRFNLSIHSYTCAGYKLRNEIINLPKFNTYSYRSECRELEKYNLDVCDPWYQGTITDDIFNAKVNKYLNNNTEKQLGIFDKIVNFFKGNYLILIGSILVIVVVIVSVRVHKKRSVLE